MPHFKSANETLHFLSDEDILNGGLALLPDGTTEITDEEAATIRAAQQPAPEPAPTVTPEQKLAAFLSANPDVMKLIQGAA